MTVKITPNDRGNPPGKLADAEIHFTEGPLEGLKLIGFSIWEMRRGAGGGEPQRDVPRAPVQRQRRAAFVRAAAAHCRHDRTRQAARADARRLRRMGGAGGGRKLNVFRRGAQLRLGAPVGQCRRHADVRALNITARQFPPNQSIGAPPPRPSVRHGHAVCDEGRLEGDWRGRWRLAANTFVSLVVGVDSRDFSAAVVRCTSTPPPSPGASRRASIGRLARPVSAAAVFGRR